MSRSLALRLNKLEEHFGSIPRTMTTEECDRFMADVFELAGEGLDSETRERLRAEYRALHSPGSAPPFVATADPRAAQAALIQHEAARMERASVELLELISRAYDVQAAPSTP